MGYGYYSGVLKGFRLVDSAGVDGVEMDALMRQKRNGDVRRQEIGSFCTLRILSILSPHSENCEGFEQEASFYISGVWKRCYAAK
jgi:hypothetical protein